MTENDLPQRDAKLMTFDHPLMKSTPISRSDVGNIFVVNADGVSTRIMPQKEFAEIPIDSFSSWQQISLFHINQ